MPLPTFILAGERRSGTTSLYHWVRCHPDIYMYPKPDMDYFLDEAALTEGSRSCAAVQTEPWDSTHSIDAYAAMFTPDSDVDAIGQKDADLLYWQPAHPRLQRWLPECKFIVTLRDPIDRAWSHYWNEVGKGRETLGFEEAVRAERTRCDKSSYARNHFSYVSRGFYDVSLESLFRHIDQSRILVLELTHVQRDPLAALQAIYRFIGVDQTIGLDGAGRRHNENRTTVRRDWTEMPGLRAVAALWTRATEAVITRLLRDRASRERARKYLQLPTRRPADSLQMSPNIQWNLAQTFAPHVARLEDMLGKQFPHWRRQ